MRFPENKLRVSEMHSAVQWEKVPTLLHINFSDIDGSQGEANQGIFLKSENFAVSLRKTKRKQILSEKRGRFATILYGQGIISGDSSSVRELSRQFIMAVQHKAPIDIQGSFLEQLNGVIQQEQDSESILKTIL